MQDAQSGGNRPRPAPSFTRAINQAVATVQHARPIATAHPSRPSHGNVGGSENQGAGGAGTARGDRFKSSSTYRHAITSTFDAQSERAQHNIIGHALTHHSPEGNMILNHVNGPRFAGTQLRGAMFSAGHVGRQQTDLLDRVGNLGRSAGGDLLDEAGNLAGSVVGGVEHAAGSLAHVAGSLMHPGSGQDRFVHGLGTGGGGLLGAGQSTPIGALHVLGAAASTPAGKVLSTPFRGAADIAQATLQHPGVIPATLKGLGEQALGAIPGLIQLPIDTIQGNLGRDLSNMGKDFSRRYGPLLAGNDKAFIDRIKKEGAAPELVDAFLAAGSAGATVGRVAGAAARRGAMGHYLEHLATADRPLLKLSGNATREQQLSANLIRAAVQRSEDAVRASRVERRNSKGLRRGMGKPGLQPREGEVVPIFQARAQRIAHSRIQSIEHEQMARQLDREVRGTHGSAKNNLGKLTALQRQAASHVIEGVVHPGDPVKAVQDLRTRKAQILAERAQSKRLGNIIPAHLDAAVDEIPLIDKLIANADKIFGPKLEAFQKAESERALRLEQNDPRFRPITAEARRLRPQGEMLGIKHPDEIYPVQLAEALKEAKVGAPDHVVADLQREHNQLLENYQVNERPGQLEKYNAEVRAARGTLPEPGYHYHQERPDVRAGDFATGSGQKAIAGAKLSKFQLFKHGHLDRTSAAYEQGLARSIKAGHQWRMVDEQFKAGALPLPTRDEIHAALGQHKSANLLTLEEQRRIMAHQGYDLAHYRFYNPGRLAESTILDEKARLEGEKTQARGEVHEPIAGLHDQITKGTTDAIHPEERYLQTTGWRAVPKEAYDEIHAGTKGGGLAGRLIGKAQGLQSAALLGTNPSWLAYQTLVHSVLSGYGTHFNLLDYAKAPIWWHTLPQEARDRMDAELGGHGMNRIQKLGESTNNQIVRGWRELKNAGLMQKATTVATAPMHMLFHGEDLQTRYFRRVVLYNQAKREAFSQLGHDYGMAARAQAQVQSIFSLGPVERMNAIVQHAPEFERLARTVKDVMGDYVRFTSRERTWLKGKAVLFYSFVRHALRTLFYVLPIKHPLMTAITGELAQMHNNEVRQLIGADTPSWAMSRLFFEGKGGKLSSIDTVRANPVTTSLTDVFTEGPKALGKLMSPAMQSAVNLVYGQTPSGQKYPRNVYSLANDMLSLAYPYRAGKTAVFGNKSQQPDSIPFLHPNPLVYKTAASQAYQAQKQAAKGPVADQLLSGLFPFIPKRDDTKVVTTHAAQKGRKGLKWGAGGGGVKFPAAGGGVKWP